MRLFSQAELVGKCHSPLAPVEADTRPLMSLWWILAPPWAFISAPLTRKERSVRKVFSDPGSLFSLFSPAPPLLSAQILSSCCLSRHIRASRRSTLGWVGSPSWPLQIFFGSLAHCFLFSLFTPTTPRASKYQAATPQPNLHSIPILDEPLCWYECRIVSDHSRVSPSTIALSSQPVYSY
ncbi:hypothetical protein V8C42DRAFT_14676 [Trichoderma barbatum]